MKYYMNSIEQLHSDDSIVEYSGSKQYETEKTALTAFYNKLAAVNADMSDSGHTYMKIEVINSVGGVIKADQIGSYYVEEVEPETTTEE